MTIKQKFYKAIYMFSTKSNTKIELCEQITDDFAIGFAEWYLKVSEKYDSHLKLQNDSKQLLEIYKKSL